MSTCSGVADTSDGWDLVTKDADCAMVRFESKMDIYGSEHRLEFVCYKDSGLKHQNTYNQEVRRRELKSGAKSEATRKLSCKAVACCFCCRFPPAATN